MARIITGIDIGSHSIKVAQIKVGLTGVEPYGYFQREIPRAPEAHREEILSSTIKDLFSEEGIKGNTVIISVPGNAVSTRVLTLPFVDSKKIAQVVPFELEGLLPFALEEIVVDHQVLERHDNRSTVMATALPQGFLERLLQILSKAGIDPKAVEMDSLALYNFARYFSKDGEGVVMDIGALKASLCILREGRLQMVRTLSYGGEAITTALQKKFSLSFEDAEELKKEAGLAGDQKVTQVIESALMPLIKEIQMTIHTYEVEKKIEIPHLFLCGGTARLKGLNQHLTQKLGRETLPLFTKVDPVRKLGWGFLSNGVKGWGDMDGIFTHSLGLALKEVLGAKGSQINFRRGKFAYKVETEAARGKAVYIGIIASVILLVVLSDGYLRYSFKEGRYRELRSQVRDIFKETLPQVKNVVDEIQQLKVAIGELGKTVSLFGNRDLTVLKVLAELSGRIPKDIQIEVQDLTISDDKIKLEAETDSFDSVDRIKSELEKSERFKEVSVGDAKIGAKEGKVRFKVNIMLVDRI